MISSTVLNDIINKPKKFWSQIKNIFSGRSQSMVNVSTDKRPSLNILSHFYGTIASKLKKSTDLIKEIESELLPGMKMHQN